MAPQHTLGKIKDLTAATLKSSVSVAATATGVVRTVAATGKSLAGHAVHGAVSAAGAARGPVPPGDSPDGGEPTPVNVVEELGLDPAPVAERPGDRPITAIDAAADPDAVDATPADVAARTRRRPS